MEAKKEDIKNTQKLIKFWVVMPEKDVEAMKEKTFCDRVATSAKILIRQSLATQA